MLRQKNAEKPVSWEVSFNRAGVPLPKAGWTWTDFKEAAQLSSASLEAYCIRGPRR